MVFIWGEKMFVGNQYSLMTLFLKEQLRKKFKKLLDRFSRTGTVVYVRRERTELI